MVYRFFNKKIGSGAKANINEVLPQELHKPVIENSKEEKGMRGLRITFGQQV